MSKFIQYADINLYFIKTTLEGKCSVSGYLPHVTIGNHKEGYTIADFPLLKDNKDAQEILDIANTQYRMERLPSNGSTDGFISGKLCKNANHSDLAAQASRRKHTWQLTAQAFIYNVLNTQRWRNGFDPDKTSGRELSQSRLDAELARMKLSLSYTARQKKRLAALRKRRG